MATQQRRKSLLGTVKVPKDAKIDFAIVSCSLVKEAAKYSQVLVEIDMPGQEDDLQRSNKTPVKLGEAKVNWTAKYDVGVGGGLAVRKALVAAMQSEEEEDSEVLLSLIGINGKGKEVILGAATYRLEKILATKKDIVKEALPILGDGDKKMGDMTVSIKALAALTALQAEADAEMAESQVKAAEKTNQVLALNVIELDLGQKKTPMDSASLRFEVVGAPPSLKPISSPALKLGGNNVASEVDFDASWAVPLGTPLRTELMKARRAGLLKLRVHIDEQKKKIVGSGDKAVPIGVAELNLSGSLNGKELRDVEDEDVELVIKGLSSSASQIGTLTCAVEVLAVLRGLDDEGNDAVDADAEAAKARRGSTFFGSKPAAVVGALSTSAVPTLHVSLDKVVLSAAGCIDPTDAKKKVTHLRVEVDMLGTEKEPLRTAVCKVASKAATVSFEKGYLAGPKSKLAAKYLAALKSEDEADSEVQLVVLACDASGKELGEIGVAHKSLEQLVSDGRDHHGPLKVIADEGGTNMGELMCKITAVAALKAAEAAAEAPDEPEPAPSANDSSRNRRRGADSDRESDKDDDGRGVGLSRQGSRSRNDSEDEASASTSARRRGRSAAKEEEKEDEDEKPEKPARQNSSKRSFFGRKSKESADESTDGLTSGDDSPLVRRRAKKADAEERELVLGTADEVSLSLTTLTLKNDKVLAKAVGKDVDVKTAKIRVEVCLAIDLGCL